MTAHTLEGVSGGLPSGEVVGESAEPAGRWRYPFALRALASRNYRLFFIGNGISLTGNWVTTATNAYLIYHLTGQNLLLGVSAFVAQVPTFVLGPLAGVLVDRWNLRRTLTVTQSLALVQSSLLATLCWTGWLGGWPLVGAILTLQLLQGVINSLDIPTRQSLAVHLVDRRDDLPNAIALNSLMVNLTRFIGPAAAGMILAAGGDVLTGAAWCYTLDAMSYLAVLAALSAMRLRPRPPRGATQGVWHELLEGLRYVRRHRTLRTALLLMCASSFFGVSFNSQLASLAGSVLEVGPRGYGYLVAAVGLGAMGSAAYLAMRRSGEGMARVISRASVVFGLALIAVSFTTNYGLALMLMAVAGSAMVLQAAGTNTLLQTTADDDKRGRVMSLFTMSFMGTVPLGALALGWAAQTVGVSWAVRVGGACLVLWAVWAWPKLRGGADRPPH